MYTLYYSQNACSLATQVVLNELNQEIKMINVQQLDNFKSINPVGSVPVLVDGKNTLAEGAAIMLHILNKHANSLFPNNKEPRQKAIQNIMFANATMHPAYSKLFFIEQNIKDENTKLLAFNAASLSINHLWQVVENQLINNDFLGGDTASAADIMLCVYSRWGAYFPVDITIGHRTKKMLDAVQSMQSFIKAVETEQRVSSKQ